MLCSIIAVQNTKPLKRFSVVMRHPHIPRIDPSDVFSIDLQPSGVATAMLIVKRLYLYRIGGQ